MVNVEEILDAFEDDLNRFETVEEKVDYLKTFGFQVEVSEDNEDDKIEESED